MKDLAEEIKQIWQIDRPEFDLTYTETGGNPQTIPRLAKGRLEIEVGGNSCHREHILFHEGGHVYLFYLGYPASRTRTNGTVPEWIGGPVDFLAERYVLELELEKRFNTQVERLNELRGRSNDAIARVPIQGEHQLQPGSGQLAMQAAVCADLLDEWNAIVDRKQISVIMKASFGELTTIYDLVLSALEQAPPLPQYPHKFVTGEVSDIKGILTSSINSIYKGSSTLEFL
jgi:hypothetical protein